ncbi:hypothetical protein HYH02_013474 [Chlamydomonas schloesseri]|uniref:Uncharacterized protein n=1 Tax=Chlamydomonas schloesseri TaxID=2026947 RepID=A0A835SW84_9CHLO|nr:hypothetical protein HYH02_013474 [Chlamydomonas schloesseri]|eukprot:KAG2431043.1 hypothetical protein HYH02_013474 [Chlamydomonas schloesseri]
MLGARTAMLAEHMGFDLGRQEEEEDESDDEDDDSGDGSDFSYEATSDGDDDQVRPIPTDAPSVPSCSYLMPGRTFTGHQRLSGAAYRRQEDWTLSATIHSCDMASGRITGSMVAQQNSGGGGGGGGGGAAGSNGGVGGGGVVGGGGSGRKAPIVTYFEGDIIDNFNHTFYTGAKWGLPGGAAGRDADLRHWGRCPGFSGRMRNEVAAGEGRSGRLTTSGHVFMRWKECFFVDVPQDCPLTITGFYYLSLCRATGAVTGYYHDSRSTPLQVVQLMPVEAAAAAAAAAEGGEGQEEEGDGGACAWGSGRAAGSGAGAMWAAEGAGANATAGGARGAGGCAGMAFGSYSLC